MGEGRTQNSKSWEEEIYWSHFQFIHFTIFLQSTTDFQQQLALPKIFSDNLKKKLPENVTLKGPSGVVWNIGLNTRGESVYFVDGWRRFVKDHSLKENDFLVFKYNGESLFEVLIFNGESFCEKAASYFVLECGQAHAEQGGNKGKNSNKSVEEVNTTNGSVECASPEKFRSLDSIRTPLALTFETTNGKTFNAGFKSASPEKPVIEVTPVQTKKRARTPKEANSWESACNKEHSEAALSKLSRKLSRNDEEKIVQSFSSSVPYFVKIIKTFHVSGSCVMNIPRQFSMEHLKKGRIKIILHNMKGECWIVNSVPTAKVPKSHTLCAGWMSFVHANNIKIGDVCIFELINDCELRVRIAGVGKEGLDCQVGKEGLDHQNEHMKLNSI
ncbi:plant-specific B3-DNA-binding domain protein [Medicago truncatula]|uniref:Plant-specific B3-DNA-binding domain protein n=2 Tax=Medicago truncatula TaxID=3880 RepID=G7I4K5_MEDTR|nr:plant-specific B3-DNA-binding domain protein [Medicago truncatula]